MKTKILKLCLIILFISFFGMGCEKDNDILELQIGDEKCLIKVVDGVEFKFCLLNEQGEPATVFNKGENFTFHFAINNKLKSTINWDNNLLFSSGFCEVKSMKYNFGPPFKIIGIEEIGQVAFSILPEKTTIWEVSWIPEENEWTKGFVSYKRTNLQYLPEGKYFTRFSHKFDLGNLETQNLTFLINFEIK